MYLPKYFAENDREKLLRLIRGYPFATLIGVLDSAPLLNHLPLVPRMRGADELTLAGHMSRRNPQAQALLEGSRVTAVFHGPHAYITPRWYAENDVPTWNYAVAHVTGTLRWIREYEPLVVLLREMADVFEGNSKDRWQFFLPDDLKDPKVLTAAIIGFEIRVESIQAKFKLSQNRSPEDRQGVVSGLATRTDEMSLKVRELMLPGADPSGEAAPTPIPIPIPIK